MTAAIRPAYPEELERLEKLAFRSKAMRGYDEAFMAASRAELAIPLEAVHDGRVFVAESEGTLLGFFALERLDERDVELTHLFVDPEHLGGGHGRVLWEHALVEADRLGGRRLVVVSDPGAEPFYVSRGARFAGEVESPVRPGRKLPLLAYALERPWPGKGGAGT